MTENQKMSRAWMAENAVKREIGYLDSIKDTGPGKAAFANLRRGAGKTPDQMPETWGLVLDGLNPEQNRSRNISPDESAVYTALTLYALGCQGQDSKTQPVQQDGVNLGMAVGKLVKKDSGNLVSLQSRMKALLGSRDDRQTAIQLRTLIPMICKDGGLDFPQLAADLVRLQSDYMKRQVGIKWARGFVTESRRDNKAKSE